MSDFAAEGPCRNFHIFGKVGTYNCSGLNSKDENGKWWASALHGKKERRVNTFLKSWLADRNRTYNLLMEREFNRINGFSDFRAFQVGSLRRV